MQVLKSSLVTTSTCLDKEQLALVELSATMRMGAKSKSGIIALAVREWLGNNPRVARAYKLINQD